MSMYLEILSPKGTLYKGNVDLVQLPGNQGSFEILYNHAPLVALLTKGKIRVIDTARNTHFFEISSGQIQVVRNKIVVLTP